MNKLRWIALLLCLTLCVSGLAFAEEGLDVAAKAVDEVVSEGAAEVPADGEAAALTAAVEKSAGDEDDDRLSPDEDLRIISKDYDDELDIYDLTDNDYTMYKGDKLLVTVDDYSVSKWSSSNKKVAKVSRLNKHQAKIKAYKRGKATITGKTKKGKKIKIKITVEDYDTPARVYIEHPDLNDKLLKTYVGCELDLTATVEPDTAETTFTWKSSNKKVVSVNKHGHIKALKTGKAKITVKTKNDKKYTITVKVLANKVNGLCDKPTTSDVKDLDDEIDFWLKSVSMTKGGKLVCEVYLLNGKYKYISSLKDFTFDVSGIVNDKEHLLASETFSRIKVRCKKNKYRLLKLTFPASSVSSYLDSETPLSDYDFEAFALDVDFGTVSK